MAVNDPSNSEELVTERRHDHGDPFVGTFRTRSYEYLENLLRLNSPCEFAQFVFSHGEGPNYKVIDLGCGEGNFVRSITKNLAKGGVFNIEVIGVDGFYNPQGITFIKSMFENLPFDPNSINVILSFCAAIYYTERINDIENVIRQIYKVLKPGGVFVFNIRLSPKFRPEEYKDHHHLKVLSRKPSDMSDIEISIDLSQLDFLGMDVKVMFTPEGKVANIFLTKRHFLEQ